MDGVLVDNGLAWNNYLEHWRSKYLKGNLIANIDFVNSIMGAIESNLPRLDLGWVVGYGPRIPVGILIDTCVEPPFGS